MARKHDETPVDPSDTTARLLQATSSKLVDGLLVVSRSRSPTYNECRYDTRQAEQSRCVVRAPTSACRQDLAADGASSAISEAT